MFDLQLPLTCNPWTTLSNPCNKVRGKILLKKSSCVLPSCVFIIASGFIIVSLWYGTWQYNTGRQDTLEERYAIKLCFKLGKNATETYGMLQTAFRPSCMNRASVFEWHKRFKEGRKSMRDDERCGRSKEVNTPELIGQMVTVRVTMLML